MYEADGSPASRVAIAFATEEVLLAVCALADAPGRLGAPARSSRPSAKTSPSGQQHPQLAILRQLSFGQPRTALLDAASGAQQLVGSRGGGLEGMLLDSVSQAILHHAPCLVAVVRRNYGNPVWEDR